ncbi:unnamed protein product [Clonostachys rhizophaga]|uniref:Uncharacterized protein n=1 Tax=Clonostachys rhizophaga TaxID=160324 RepID=A0A9N9VUL5_9HYPO|nr:unnamed protein product [Clonostachys rhizophaga]
MAHTRQLTRPGLQGLAPWVMHTYDTTDHMIDEKTTISMFCFKDAQNTQDAAGKGFYSWSKGNTPSIMV